VRDVFTSIFSDNIWLVDPWGSAQQGAGSSEIAAQECWRAGGWCWLCWLCWDSTRGLPWLFFIFLHLFTYIDNFES
jgi:hypothetical protein